MRAADGGLVDLQDLARHLEGAVLVLPGRQVGGEVQPARQRVRVGLTVAALVPRVDVPRQHVGLVEPSHLPERDREALARAQRVHEVLAEHAEVTLVGLLKQVDRVLVVARLPHVARQHRRRVQRVGVLVAEHHLPVVQRLLVEVAGAEGVTHQAQVDGEVVRA